MGVIQSVRVFNESVKPVLFQYLQKYTVLISTRKDKNEKGVSRSKFQPSSIKPEPFKPPHFVLSLPPNYLNL